ncbi:MULTISPECIES: hypothetical protein [Pseudomonas]|uniref:Uncharacterized protein n=1 Tax=Pseudomonas fluorescens TaxID=294 RepID=A0A5E7Q309_PSEFL|nr:MULTISPECIES: hypothetical protein [Pseudomonas]KPG96581.1 hypothetical protein AK821_14840 [Pseudomonas sp. RIT-PI-r]MCP1487805.1 hypothetical protein [Pseudomonas fluorescens]PRB48679.1 hypothetical protein CQ025_14825 [Pseudomonas sp. MYb3]PRC32893.1 hypothetical protein CQ009_16620 [Pseudomonas sp. MYb2]VVP56145.1 hypothetical protein PS896_05712 [Pseudomonas fluorescens]
MHVVDALAPYFPGVDVQPLYPGRWHYAEYPDQPQTAGSYLIDRLVKERGLDPARYIRAGNAAPAPIN